MPFFLSPIGNSQIIDANGDPLNGGFLETYLAGTSTPRTTYTTQAGDVAQGAVMTLGSLGYPENGAVWMQGGIALKFIIKNAAGVVQSTFDNISGIGDTDASPSEWVLFDAAPTYVSATSFTLVGDQTNTFQVNRKLQSANTGGTVYSQVVSSVFLVGTTTVTVLNLLGVLDAGLSSVSYGLLAADNQSIPPVDQIVNAQTGTTYTYAKSDKGKLVTHTNAAAIAGTLPVASTTGKSWWMDVQNRGAGTLTITPTTSTIDGVATLVLTAGNGARLVSDGTNYFTQRSQPRKIINVVEATPYTTYTSAGSVSAYDDTIPQISEGTALMSVSIAPTSATSRLRVEFLGYFGVSAGANFVWSAMYRDSTVNAVSAAAVSVPLNTVIAPMPMVYEVAAGSTSATTFSIRFAGEGITAYVNGSGLGRRFGGSLAATLRVTEIAA